MSRNFTPEDDDLIGRLLDAGFTYKQIGERFGVNRRIIAGRVHRNKQTGRSKRTTRPPGQQPKACTPKPVRTKPFAPRPKPKLVELPAVAPLDEHAVSFEQYDPALHCGWPMQLNPTVLCGAVKRPGSSYCQYHHEKATASASRSAPRSVYRVPHSRFRAV